MAALTVSVVLLALLVVFQMLITFGLVRRLRAVEADGGVRPSTDRFPQSGMRIPHFEVDDTDGDPITDRDFASGPALVAVVSPACEPCERVKTQLLNDPPRESFFAFVNGAATTSNDASNIARTLGAMGRAAVFENGDVMAARGVQLFPTLLMLHDGVVVAASND